MALQSFRADIIHLKEIIGNTTTATVLISRKLLKGKIRSVKGFVKQN